MAELLKVQMERIAERIKGDQKAVVQKVMLNLVTKIIERSPVGNPENWKANQGMLQQRRAYDQYANLHNMAVDVDPNNFNASGQLKRGIKYRSRLTKREKSENFALPAGKGYVGGHFRANWNMALNASDETTSDEVDKSGGRSIQQAKQGLQTLKIGDTVYFTNALPYAQRLEYEGWSMQAPAGMVRVTITEFNAAVEQAINETR